MSMRGRTIGGKYHVVESVRDRWRGEVRGAGGFKRSVAIQSITEDVLPALCAIAEVQHPNVVQVLDACEDGDDLYAILEWVDAISLGELCSAVRQLGMHTPWPVVAAIGVGALRGLAAAHEHDILHGGLSVDSILLDTRGISKLGDFGVDAPQPFEAPEVALHVDRTAQTDLFAIGAALWEALADAPPFGGDRDHITGFQAGEVELPKLARVRRDVPPRLCAAIERALAFATIDRFATADDMVRELAPLLAEVPWRKNPQADLGRAVVEARTVFSRSELLIPDELEEVSEGEPENPILLTRLAAEPLSDDDLMGVHERPADHDGDYAGIEVIGSGPPREA
jgi:serine/threonine-protein kinase